eukprot:m.190341 g.190341  ORF g.190341 m.190341 type:complete len:179 (-) comp16756_c0_seq3:82-618(-)
MMKGKKTIRKMCVYSLYSLFLSPLPLSPFSFPSLHLFFSFPFPPPPFSFHLLPLLLSGRIMPVSHRSLFLLHLALLFLLQTSTHSTSAEEDADPSPSQRLQTSLPCDRLPVSLLNCTFNGYPIDSIDHDCMYGRDISISCAVDGNVDCEVRSTSPRCSAASPHDRHHTRDTSSPSQIN